MNNNDLNVGTFVPTNANEGGRNRKLTPKIRGNLEILCQNLNE